MFKAPPSKIIIVIKKPGKVPPKKNTKKPSPPKRQQGRGSYEHKFGNMFPGQGMFAGRAMNGGDSFSHGI